MNDAVSRLVACRMIPALRGYMQLEAAVYLKVGANRFHFEAHRAYFERFATGVECYLNGDWVWAREYLVWCYAQNPADRPAVVLLEYMAAKRFAAPKGWLGCRRDDYEDDADALRV